MIKQYSTIDKINIFQNNLIKKYNIGKERRKIQYQKFLTDPKRHPPSIQMLTRWRNRFVVVSFIMLCITIVITFRYVYIEDWSGDPLYDLLFNLPGLTFLCAAIFAGLFDYALFKRSNGSAYTIINHIGIMGS